MKTPSDFLKIFLIVLTLFPMGCASNPKGDSLIGKWQLNSVYEEGQKIGVAPEGEVRILEFYPDGTATMDMGDISDLEMTRTTYKIIGETITFDGMIGVLIGPEHTFKLDGNKLSLNSNSITLEFIRLR